MVFAGFADSSGIVAQLLTVLGRQGRFSVKPLRAIFDLVLSKFFAGEILEKEKDIKLWNPTVNLVVKTET